MIGVFIGAIIGFKTGNLMGVIIGAFVGNAIENWVSENIFGKPTKQAQVQQAYFEALFTAMGKLAKADGIISKDEIKKCEMIMRRMNLDNKQRELAIRYFNQGKQDHFDIGASVQKFQQLAGRSYSLKQMFLEMLLEVAVAENKILLAEWKILNSVCVQLNFPQQIFITMVRMRGFDVGQQGSHNNSNQYYQQWKPPQQQKTNSYQVLGVVESDSKVVIRRAYKKLMSSHHPDKLIAKGLPPEMVEVAKEKTQNIQVAWEDIKSMRGF